MESPTAPLDLTLSDVERSSHSGFKTLHLVMEPSQALCYFNHQQETTCGESNDTITVDLE